MRCALLQIIKAIVLPTANVLAVVAFASAQTFKAPATPNKGLPPLKYVPPPAPIPFYPPGDKWNVQAEPLKEMQAPLSPEDSLKHLALPPGFHAELFAAEPDILKVIGMAWDARGRLWVAETVDYPNDKQPVGQGNDRIKICEDTDGDGRADRFTVFADKLSIPTSLVFANGGVIVAQAPDMLFLEDTDGDDRADVRHALFTGWGTRDTHAGPSNLRYGIDNWIYGVVGYSGFEGTVGGKPMRFSQGIFRFKLVGPELQLLTTLSNNAWGLGFSETGEVFTSTANNQHSVHLAIANRYYESVRGWHGLGSAGIADSEEIRPITEFHRQMDWHGKFTAAAGHALYTARAFPKPYWNRIAFVTEGTGHLIHQGVLESQGSSYVSRDGGNFLASSDEWTAPIAAEVGPDGAVWVSDWYNYIFQHNPTPHGFETGKGNAYVSPLRDKKHGRIYRIVHEGAAKPDPAKRLDDAPFPKLIEALGDDNLFWRLTAQRLLVESRDMSAFAYLLARNTSQLATDGIGNRPGHLHQLWTMQGIARGEFVGVLSDQAETAMTSPIASIRRAGLQILPREEENLHAVLRTKVLSDPDAQVRLAAMLALSEMPENDLAGPAILQAMAAPGNVRDRWISDAATIAAARHHVSFLKAALAKARTAKPATQKVAENLITNATFEDAMGWKLTNWQGIADAAVDKTDGQIALRIDGDAEKGADSSMSTVVRVSPQTDYRLSARLRTRDVRKGTGLGALVNVHELTDPVRVATNAVTGTTGWTRVQVDFNSGDHSQLTINCLLGGWGKSFGTAWFNDVRLEPANTTGDGIARMIRVVATHYAQAGPADSAMAMLSKVRGTDEETAAAALDGLLAGWPADGAMAFKADAAAQTVLQDLSGELSPDNRTRLATFAQRLGLGGALAEDVKAARRGLVAVFSDNSLDAASRVDAARRLLALADDAESIDAILTHVSPRSSPAFAAALIKAFADSRQDVVAAKVLGKWSTLSPAARKAAIDVLLRRGPWHARLLDALEQRDVVPGDLSPEQSQQLVAVTATPEIAEQAKKLLAGGRVSNPDRNAVVEKLLPIADKRGTDLAAGKASFAKNCASCHAFAGVGGRVGPDLTGIGKNPRREILLNIIDPNRSVEGNFRLWIVQTTDGRTLSGRLENENQTSVELLDSAGSHVVQRKDIRRMVSQPTSIMPEGFELLPAPELANLLEFLAQPVEAPR